MKLTFGAILPHTLLFGGVKRFFELGDVFQTLGHQMIIFTPDGVGPEWYSGTIKTVQLGALHECKLDVLFCTEIGFVEDLHLANARNKIFYFVKLKDKLNILRKYPEIKIFSNSSNAYNTVKRKYNIDSFRAFGGINTTNFFPKPFKEEKDQTTVIAYGRLKRIKGTHLVVKACEQLYKKGFDIKLILFDTPVDKDLIKRIEAFSAKVPCEYVLNHPVSKNVELFHRADIFVSAELSAGHSNTTAEAMASGIAAIGTTAGTTDFLLHEKTGLVVPPRSRKIAHAVERLIKNPSERSEFAKAGRKKIGEFSWERLAERIIEHVS